MKRVLLSLFVLLAVCRVVEAQDLKRWTIGLSVSPERKVSISDFTHRGDGYKMLPSISYNMNSWLSVGIELNLPLSNKGVYSSTGAELFVAFRGPRLGGFGLTLAPVLGGSMIGAYSFSQEHSVGVEWNLAPGGLSSQIMDRYNTLRYRWYVGLRPTLSYAVSSRWSLTLSYALLGYRSHRDLPDIYYAKDGGVKPQGAWGLTTNATYSSNFRLGVSYSF